MCSVYSNLTPGAHDYYLKFLLVGDSDVGKSEILNYLEGYYENNILGINSKTSLFNLDGKKIKLQLWDTSGQGRFCTIIRSYSRGAHGVLLVYDITNKWSFKGIDRWLKEIDNHIPGIPKILIGNRLHLEYKREVSQETAELYASKHNMEFFEISPLCNFNVTESIMELMVLALHRIGMDKIWTNKTVKSLQELCFISLMVSVKFFQINRLCLPSNLKSQLKTYYMTNHKKKNELRNLPSSLKPLNHHSDHHNSSNHSSTPGKNYHPFNPKSLSHSFKRTTNLWLGSSSYKLPRFLLTPFLAMSRGKDSDQKNDKKKCVKSLIPNGKVNNDTLKKVSLLNPLSAWLSSTTDRKVGVKSCQSLSINNTDSIDNANSKATFDKERDAMSEEGINHYLRAKFGKHNDKSFSNGTRKFSNFFGKTAHSSTVSCFPFTTKKTASRLLKDGQFRV
ncbi:unnamed protein product [Gordionus sp. m RMFG-2023]|uniref:uncharacterized protein LOC135922858 isoform X2 n=1 Tax=Gordionus sp. m RMFG-2023 TaxID=3053472 RepID=UPI0030DEDB84